MILEHSSGDMTATLLPGVQDMLYRSAVLHRIPVAGSPAPPGQGEKVGGTAQGGLCWDLDQSTLPSSPGLSSYTRPACSHYQEVQSG